MVARFAFAFLAERPLPRAWLGITMVGAGVVVLALKIEKETTMGSFSGWPSVARKLDAIPTPLGDELAQQFAANEYPIALIYVTADPTAARRGPWARTRGVQVLALTDQRLILGVQAVPADEPRWFACAYDQVVAWELWQNLLYGRLDVYGDPAGQPLHAWMEFNTVGADLITAALAPLQRTTLGQAHTHAFTEAPTVVVDDLPYHFASYLRHALLPNEFVQEQFVQAAIIAPVMRFWKHIVATPALLVATDQRLLIFREEPVTRKARYGFRSFTLPRARAAGLRMRDEAEHMLLEYAPDPSMLRVQLDLAHRPALQRMCAALDAPEQVSHPIV